MANQKIIGWPQSIGKAKQRFKAIAKVADAGMVWERESIFALQAIEKSDYLQKCAPNSFRDAILNVASIGLSLNPAEKLAYLVPRDGTAVLDVSYQGLLKLATDTGSVMWAKVELVYEQDEFDYKGMNEMPFHKPRDPFKTTRGKLRGAFCAARLSNNELLIEMMGVDEIHKIREKSKAYSRKKGGKPAPSGPWVTWYEEMVKKTVMKRAYKSWPKSQRMAEAIDVLNHHEGIDFDITPAADITEESVLLVNEEQLTKLNGLIKDSHVDISKIYKAFSIGKIEDLPNEKFEECKARLVSAKVAFDKKHPEDKSDADASTEKNPTG